MKLPKYGLVGHWGDSKGLMYCYEYCGHMCFGGSGVGQAMSCNQCATIRKWDEVGDYIELCIRNNLNRPIGLSVLYDQLCGETGWYDRDVMGAAYHGEEVGRFIMTHSFKIGLHNDVI